MPRSLMAELECLLKLCPNLSRYRITEISKFNVITDLRRDFDNGREICSTPAANLAGIYEVLQVVLEILHLSLVSAACCEETVRTKPKYPLILYNLAPPDHISGVALGHLVVTYVETFHICLF